MSSEDEARIVSVAIEGHEEGRVIKAPADTRSVKVTFADGSTVEVNADGGMTVDDGRTVTVDAAGEIKVTGQRKAPGGGKYDVRVGPGVRGAQFGDGNTQVNQW